ncbi:MAG: hypothetical protein AAFR71_05555 [Pseudomonadota bacterium]
MVWVLGAIGAIAFTEILFRLPFLSVLSEFIEVVRKVKDVMTSNNISDEWKEKALPKYSMGMMRSSSYLLAILLVAFAPMLALDVAARLFDLKFLEFAMSPFGIIFMTILGFAYFVWRHHYGPKSL